MATPRIAKLTSMNLEGIDDLRQTLTVLAPKESRNILRNATHGVATVVRDTMKRKVTKRSHDLEKSIYALRRRGKPDAPVSEVRMRGTPHPHGLILEFGSSNTRAQPFIVPSAEEVRPQLARIYRDQYGAKLEKALAKRTKDLK